MKYKTQKERIKAKREDFRRYYKRNAEKIKSKQKVKYHKKHPNSVYYFTETTFKK